MQSICRLRANAVVIVSVFAIITSCNKCSIHLATGVEICQNLGGSNCNAPPNTGPANTKLLDCACTCGVSDVAATMTYTPVGQACVPPGSDPQTYCSTEVAATQLEAILYLFGRGQTCPTLVANCSCTAHPKPGSTLLTGFALSCAQTCTNIICDPSTCLTSLCNCTKFSPLCALPTQSSVCYPKPGNADPPTSEYGIMSEILSKRIDLQIDPTISSLFVDVSLDIDGIHHEDIGHSNFDDSGNRLDHLPQLSGDLTLHGDLSTGVSAQVKVDLNLSVQNMKFHFGGIPDYAVEDLRISGGSGDNLVTFDASGNAFIGPNVLDLIFHMHQVLIPAVGSQESNDIDVEFLNQQPLMVNVDFAHKRFTINGQVNIEGSTGMLSGGGIIKNQPPRATISPIVPNPVECTSPNGAEITLNGSQSCDPDGCDPSGVDDLRGFSWFRGPPFDPNNLLGNARLQTVIAPKGSSQYSLVVSDSSVQADIAQMSITVQDTAPPDLTLDVDPNCLWPVNHKMVLFSLNTDLHAQVKDICDDSPLIEIVNVVSNQATRKNGTGNSDPDVVFGSGAFCVRAERDGSSKTARQYTVTVAAIDASGNTTTRDILIEVPHDQGQGKCAKIDTNRIVEDDDARCLANIVPPHGATMAELDAAEKAKNAASTTPVRSGCSTTGHDTPSVSWFALIGLFLYLHSRRRV